MDYQKQVARLIEEYGEPMRIRPPEGGEEQCTAFIQPLRYKNKMYLDGDYLPVGFADTGHFLYIGLPEPRLDRMPGHTVLLTGDGQYTVKRAECVKFSGRAVYVWAVLQPYIEEVWEHGGF